MATIEEEKLQRNIGQGKKAELPSVLPYFSLLFRHLCMRIFYLHLHTHMCKHILYVHCGKHNKLFTRLANKFHVRLWDAAEKYDVNCLA